ncbi:MAG: hypothetical protein ACRDJS_04155 [Actinomycetota bacterium]
MALRDRVFKYTDAPMSWTKAILIGFAIWIFSIVFLGQLPSVIIYKADQYVAEIIDISKKIPMVNDAGLNTRQVSIVRDLVANGVQMTTLIAMLVFAYFWQEKKRKRVGGRGVQDPVKGYLSGK